MLESLTSLLLPVSKLVVPALVLAILIFVHELGHFLVAKWNGVGVLEFAIGFGKKVWSRRIGETRYSLGLIPLGGYVRMVQEDPGLSQTTGMVEKGLAGGDDLEPEDLALLQNRDRWFYTKGYLAKSSIVFAGPLFNILFAILLAFVSLLTYGQNVMLEGTVIDDVVPNDPAAKAGMKPGDRILSINGEQVSVWKDLAARIAKSGGNELVLQVERPVEGSEAKEQVEIKVAGALQKSELAVLEGKEQSKDYKIGISPQMGRAPVGIGEAAQGAVLHVYTLSHMTVRGLWGMATAKISPKNIGGPIFIFQEAARNAKKGLESLLDFMIMLSISLAILNLLPIPILDGGHLVFFTLEAIKGGPLSVAVQERAAQVGVLLLLILMVFAFGNDLSRMFGLQ